MMCASVGVTEARVISLHILFQFVLIKLGIVIFGHDHLDCHTDSQALRAEYCIVAIPHNRAI